MPLNGVNPSAQRPTSRFTWITPLLAVLFAAVWLFAPLTSFGVWDPHEVESADLARRVAVHAFGAERLARDGDPAGIPTLTDLGSGELGVTSIAVSFSVFGVSDWAGRLPLALWGFAGAMALYLLLARTTGPRAGLFGVLALLALPAFHLQARTMIGDVVPMSALAIATTGGVLLVIERTRRWRIVSIILFTVGVAAGFMSRGVVLCVVPVLAVGALSFVRGLEAPRAVRLARAMLGAGILLALFAVIVFVYHDGDPLTRRAVGTTLVDPEPVTSTFDRMFRHLGHSLFPLSALLPVAIAVLSRRASSAHASTRAKREDRAAAGRVVILAGGLASLVASLLVTPVAGALPFFGVVFAAAILGDYAATLRAEPPSRASVAVTLMLLFVLRTDLQRSPDRMLESFALGAMESVRAVDGHARLVDLAAVALAGLLVLSMRGKSAENSADEPSPAEDKPRGYVAIKRRELRARMDALVAVSDGDVVFAFVLIEAALVGMAIMLAVGGRLGWEALASLPDAFGRFGVAAWWATPLVFALFYVAWTFARDGAEWLRGRRLTGSTLVGASFAVSGGVLGFGYFPAFFDHASPRHALQRYEGMRSEGDALGLFGTSPALAPFYVREPVTTFTELPRAFMFLDKSELSEGTHFLAVRREELPMLNQLWRLEHRTNVPVVDASSDVLLVASSTGGEPSESPLDRIVLDSAPSFAHGASAIFDESVELVSWQIESSSGKQVDVLLTGEPYTLRVALEVKRRPEEEWTAFVHVEKKGRRTNGDHAPLGGAYPMRLWLPHDVVVDEHVFTLPPNFTPDTYRVHFGFFMAGWRIPVTEGVARENRVELGSVEVR